MPTDPLKPQPQPISRTLPTQDGHTSAASGGQVSRIPTVEESTQRLGLIANEAGVKAYNPFADAQAYSYNPESAAERNKNFQRFYSHSDYEKLGFNPWVNNEALYNEKGSKTGDVFRAIKSAVPQIATGFTSVISGYQAGASGDWFTPDYKSSADMNYWNTIGSSSRGGGTGLASNIISNSGYTVGIMGEMFAELYLLKKLPFGAFGRMRNIAKNFETYNAAVEGVAATVNTVSKDYGVAKTAWEGLKKGAKFLNPLENTTQAISDIYNIGKFKSLSALAKVSSTAGAFYRDVRMANLAVSEARMEGGSAEYEAEQQMISEYKEKNGGKAPSGDELMTMKLAAKEAGAATLGWNVPVIFLTNKFTFEPLLRSFAKESEFALRGGKRFIQKADGQFVKSTVKARTIEAFRPKNLFTAPLKYFGRNFSEGFQETAQEITSATFIDHYKQLYQKSDPKKGLDYALGENVSWGTFGRNALDNAPWTGKGFEVFASGFLMGGLLGMVRAPFKAGVDIYSQYKQDKSEYEKNALNTLNEINKNPLRMFGSGILNFAQGTQAVANQAKAEENGMIKEWHDNEHINLTSQAIHALETGTWDVFLDKVRGVKSMDAKAITEAYGLNGEEVLQKIDKIISRAEQVKQNWDKWNTRYENPFKPWSYKQDTPEFKKEALGYVAWNNAKNIAVFNETAVKRNADRIQSITDDLLNIGGMKAVKVNDVSLLLNPNDIERELQLLDTEVEINEASATEETRKSAKQLKTKRRRLEKLRNSLIGYYAAQQYKNMPKELLDKNPKFKEDVENLRDVSRSELFEAYEGYMGHLVEGSGRTQPIHYLDLRNSFDKLLDIHELGQDNVFHSEVVDILADPKGFIDQYDRMNKATTDLYNNREQIAKDSIEYTQKKIEDNAILGILFQRGFVLAPDAVDQLIKKKEVPNEFFDTNAKQVVQRGDPRHTELANIVKNYVEATTPVPAAPVAPAVVTPVAVVSPVVPVTTTSAAKVTIDLEAKFAEVATGEQLEELENELLGMLSLPLEERGGINSTIITEKITSKARELAAKLVWDDISVGNILSPVDAKEGNQVVIGKTASTLRFAQVGEPAVKGFIKKENLNDYFLYKYSAQMTKNPVKVDAASAPIAKQNTTQDDNFLNNKELVDEIIKDAFSREAEIIEEFEAELGCK